MVSYQQLLPHLVPAVELDARPVLRGDPHEPVVLRIGGYEVGALELGDGVPHDEQLGVEYGVLVQEPSLLRLDDGDLAIGPRHDDPVYDLLVELAQACELILLQEVGRQQPEEQAYDAYDDDDGEQEAYLSTLHWCTSSFSCCAS